MNARWLVLTLAALPGAAVAADDPKATEVDVCKPVAREVTDSLESAGRADAAERVDVRARVSGFVTKIAFKEGSDVEKGALLFEIDPRPYQAELEKAKAELVMAEAAARATEAQYARARAIYEKGAGGKEDVDRAKADLDVAKAMIEAKKAVLEHAKLNLSYTQIAAPIAGRIGRCLIDVGNLVKADEALLTTIVTTDPVHVYFDLDERTYLRLRRLANEGPLKTGKDGPPVGVALADEDDYPRQGRLDFVNNTIDPATGTLRCRTVLPNPKGLILPGMFVRVRLPLGEPYKALLVPESAVVTGKGARVAVVYVVNEQDRIERRAVKVGQHVGPLRVIQEGLKESDRVVVKGSPRVVEGAAVIPKFIEISGKK
jgi:multidrug efflux system membrane fusion protein